MGQEKMTVKKLLQKEYAYKVNWDYFYSKAFSGVDSSTMPQELFEIIGLFAKDCNYHIRQCNFHNNALTMKGYFHYEESELMLRFDAPRNELIVKRVCFIHRHEGYMTELFAILKRIRRRSGYPNICMESVITAEMESWCRKHKLIRQTDDLSSNWYMFLPAPPSEDVLKALIDNTQSLQKR